MSGNDKKFISQSEVEECEERRKSVENAMAIIINNVDKTYTLTTKNTMYQMKVDKYGILEHTYYGEKMDYMDMSYSVKCGGASFSPNFADAICQPLLQNLRHDTKCYLQISRKQNMGQ